MYVFYTTQLFSWINILMLNFYADKTSVLYLNPLNTKLNPIRHLQALLEAHYLHVSRVRVKFCWKYAWFTYLKYQEVSHSHHRWRLSWESWSWEKKAHFHLFGSCQHITQRQTTAPSTQTSVSGPAHLSVWSVNKTRYSNEQAHLQANSAFLHVTVGIHDRTKKSRLLTTSANDTSTELLQLSD